MVLLRFKPRQLCAENLAFKKFSLNISQRDPLKRITDMTHKSIFISFILLSLLSLSPAIAQDVEPVDEIIARGTIQTDPAMSAWNSGDFETAEIEFKQNAFCALRVERNFAAGVEASRDSSIRADVAGDAISQQSPTGGQGGANVSPSAPPPPSVNQVNSSDFKKNESATKRTCEDRGFQIYMMGMSQLKLGKRDDAKEAFKRATFLRKTLYDAHFRLSLLEYQDGNIEKAKKEFKKLRKLERKYRKGKANEEIKAQISYLENLLG